MRFLVGGIGCCAALVLVGLSSILNFRFGFSLGASQVDAIIYGSISAAGDVLKSTIPFFVVILFQGRRWFAALLGVLLWIVASGYSLTSSVGFAAANRNIVTGSELRGIKREGDFARELQELIDERKLLGTPRDAVEVRRVLEGQEQNRRWVTTNECRKATVEASRVFCRQYKAVEAELARSIKYQSLTAKIRELREKIRQLEDSSTISSAKSQIELLRGYFGSEARVIEAGLITLMAILVELGSGLGLFLASTVFWGKQREAYVVPGSAAEFCQKMLVPADDSLVSMSEMYGHYAEWCRADEKMLLSLEEFQQEIVWLLDGVVPHSGEGFSGIGFRAVLRS